MVSTSAAGRRRLEAAEQEIRLGAGGIDRLMERIGEAALLVDLSTRAVLKANSLFLKRSGYGPEDIEALDLLRLHDLKDLERILQAASQPRAERSVVPSASCCGKDGSLCTVDVGVEPLGGSAGAVALLTYGEQSGGAPQAGPPQRGRERPVLCDFTRKLAAVRDRESLGRALVEAAAGLMASDRAFLLGQGGGAGGAEVLASCGIPAGALEVARRWLADLLGVGLLSAERPRVVADIDREEGLRGGRDELAAAGVRAFVVLPLEDEARVLGAWVLAYRDARAAGECDLELGRVFAAHLSGALAGVQALERTRREKSHHEVLTRIISWLRGPFDLEGILQSLTGELCRTLGADRCLVLASGESDAEPGATLRVEAEHCRAGETPLRALGAIRFSSTALGQAVLYSKEPLAVEDLKVRPDLTEDHEELVQRLDLRGLVMAKIISRQEFIGLVAVATSGRPRPWSAEEIALVQAVADHVAVTLATGRLARASQERAQQIERERREWERTFDAIPEMISIHDGYGRLLRANLAMQVRLGGDPRAFVGRECGEILEAVMGRSGDCPHEAATRGRRPIACEVEGERGAFALTAIPCFDAAGKCLYIIHVCKEITEEKTIREQLLQTEKMAAVGKLVSGVAHELNNPLAGVIGFAEILLDRPGDARLKKSLTRIREEAERASRIVRNLLTFARKHKPESVMVSVNAVLEKTLELRAYDLRVNKIKVVADLAPSLPMTLADPNQLLQVFMNIITNAEQAMREARGRGTLKLSTSSADGNIRIAVQDEGPGIQPGNLKKVFDPFFTTKPVGRGTGLGLSICHGIIKEVGGTISVSSSVGQGTVFTVELPVVSGPERRAEARPPSDIKAPPSRILVVDDEITIRELMHDALEDRGHTVEVVDSGLAALEALREKTYDLIVSDLKMPEMDGQELFARLTADSPHLLPRLIFTSGDTMSAETRSFLDRAGRPYLLKPFKMQDMVELADKILLAASRPDEGPTPIPDPGDNRPAA
ncbi:MAG: response regulator [Acidobacteria bacterium]|nr:response regulator [Acidobacteriota bacterium]